MELMPFNFDRLPNGRVFISNLAGFHHFINEQELLDLSDEQISAEQSGNDSNLLIVFYVQIVPDDFVMQLHRF
ncbi:radical SAM protein [Klebsiella pneumoniae]|nr:radical SAM protein [Klebsiella pneumoniae]